MPWDKKDLATLYRLRLNIDESNRDTVIKSIKKDEYTFRDRATRTNSKSDAADARTCYLILAEEYGDFSLSNLYPDVPITIFPSDVTTKLIDALCAPVSPIYIKE